LKDYLKDELKKRVKEALLARDWKNMERWARQWILMEPNSAQGFRWLARSTFALNDFERASYAYGRVLDFEPENEEAKKYFTEYPSQNPAPTVKPIKQETPASLTRLKPEDKALLAQKELDLAKIYDALFQYSHAAEAYHRSFQWKKSQFAGEAYAKVLHKMGRGLEGIRFLREQLYEFPEWVKGRLVLGRILFELGHLNDARREWQNTLAYDPENREALDFLRGHYASLDS